MSVGEIGDAGVRRPLLLFGFRDVLSNLHGHHSRFRQSDQEQMIPNGKLNPQHVVVDTSRLINI